jgi:tape measure domain-containing protein
VTDLVLNLRIRANADGSAQVLGQTSDGIRRVSTESGNASRALRGMESAASGLIRTIAPLLGIYELISFGHKVVEDTATVQDLDTRLHSLTKTAGDYAQTVDYITTVADAQHKKINDLSDSYAKLRVLQNSGIISGQQTKGLLEGLNNAASELGAGNYQLKQSFFGLAQGLAAGVLHAEELNQVTEPMPGLMNSLDKALGQGAGGFRRLTNDGKVTSQMFAETLVKALHDFDGAAAATAQNVNAKSTDIGNSWTRLITSVEPTTSALWTPIQDGAKDALDSIREFNEAAITVGDTNVSASNLAKGAWDVTTSAISAGWAVLKEAGLGSATDTVSGWIVSGDQMKSNVKFLVNDMIGLFVGLGHSVGIIFGALTVNVGNTIDNAIARASAAAGDVARMGVGDFSFSSSKAVVVQPMVNGFADAAKQFKEDISTDWIGTYIADVNSAAVAQQNLTNEQKKAADAAEQATAKTLQAAAAHNSHGNAVGQSAEATKKAAAEAKKHADAIAKEIDSLNDQHQKLALSERAYEEHKLAALGMTGAVKDNAMAIWDSNKALEAQKAGMDAARSALDAEQDRYDKLTMSAQQYLYTQLLLKGVSPGEAVETVSLSAVNDKIEADKKAVEAAKGRMQEYDDLINRVNDSTNRLGATNAAVFDGALGGINTLVGVFQDLGDELGKTTKQQEELNKAYAQEKNDIGKRSDLDAQQKYNLMRVKEAEYIKLNQKYEDDKTKSALTGTRQIIAATTKMFDEKSSAAKALHTVETGIAVAQMAMQGAQMAKDLAATGVSLAAGAAKFFAQSGWAGFAGVAAMGAVMAGLGYGMMSNSGKSSPPPEYAKDTGTVLGDPTAKSESIDKTYNLLKDIHADEYATLRSIDKGIADLHSGITDVITRLFQAGGLKDFATMPAASAQSFGMVGNTIQMGAMLGSGGLAKFDPIANKVLGFLFGGKQTSTITAQGIQTGATSISDIMNGGNLSAQQFATIETKTKGGLFSKDKVSYSQQYAAIDAATQKALNDVFNSMGSTMLGLADNLGMGLSDRVKNYIIPGLTVDLKGLDGEAAAKKLNGVLSTALDTMSTSVFGDRLGQYQQLGEGMLETAVRVVAEIAVVEDALAKSGLSITGDAIAISDGLAQAAGGLKEFQKQFDSYYQKFYTDAERNVFTQKQLAGQLGDVNLLLPATRDGYRHLVEALNINNAADQERYSLLIKLSDAADTYYSHVETAANAARQIAEQQRSLDIQLMEASGRAIEALTEKRKDELAAMDASLRFSQQAVWALSAANKAVDDAMNVLKKSVSDQKALNNTAYQASIAANNLQKEAANDLLSSLKTVAANLKSALSSTVVESDAFTRQRRLSAQAVLASALSSAKAGGSLANYAGLDQALIDIAKPSEQLYTSFIDFVRDQGRTGNVLAGLADHTQSQISVAEQTLLAIDTGTKALTDGFNAENARLDSLVTTAQAQIDAINGTTAVVMTVNDAVINMTAAMDARMATANAISSAQYADKAELAAKNTYEAAAAQAAQSTKILNYVSGAAQDYSAQAQAARALSTAPIAPAPSTWQSGQSGNAVWEQVLSWFNAEHMKRYGITMNRPWSADGDAQRQYSELVLMYNSMSASAAQAAAAQAAGLENLANATAALIPGYQQTASVDQTAAAQAAASYATAKAYTAAAQAAVPGINSFEVGTNYVVDERWAKIHPGERIMPAADNRELMMRLSEPAPSNNSELVTEIRRLNGVVAKLQSELEKITKNTGETKTNTSDTATVLKKCTLGGDAVRTTAV